MIAGVDDADNAELKLPLLNFHDFLDPILETELVPLLTKLCPAQPQEKVQYLVTGNAVYMCVAFQM